MKSTRGLVIGFRIQGFGVKGLGSEFRVLGSRLTLTCHDILFPGLGLTLSPNMECTWALQKEGFGSKRYSDGKQHSVSNLVWGSGVRFWRLRTFLGVGFRL